MVTSVRHSSSPISTYAYEDSCLTHAVEAAYPPLEFWDFIPAWVIYIITGFVISFLKANDSIQSVFFQFGIFFGFEVGITSIFRLLKYFLAMSKA